MEEFDRLMSTVIRVALVLSGNDGFVVFSYMRMEKVLIIVTDKDDNILSAAASSPCSLRWTGCPEYF